MRMALTLKGPVVALVLSFAFAFISRAASQSPQPELQPPGRLVDLGGYRIHIWCTGVAQPNRPTVVLSAGGGDFATDWSLVQRPLADSIRVCSCDRPGSGWSDPGPIPRTFRQETFEVHAALQKSGESPPFLMVGHSIGAFVARLFAETYRNDVVGVVLVGPANESGKLGYRGQFVLPRLLATGRPVPEVASFAANPPSPRPGVETDSCRAQAERSARIWRPYDQLRAQAQRYRVWALSHPTCGAGQVIGAGGQDDYFAEEMAGFFAKWSANPHPLGDLPLVVVMGTQGSSVRPPYLSEADWRSDSLRTDLSKLSRRGLLVRDSLSGHHVQLDNPNLVVTSIRDLLRQVQR